MVVYLKNFKVSLFLISIFHSIKIKYKNTFLLHLKTNIYYQSVQKKKLIFICMNKILISIMWANKLIKRLSRIDESQYKN
jgi:hypothetical protein